MYDGYFCHPKFRERWVRLLTQTYDTNLEW
jgi:hypothetical protein